MNRTYEHTKKEKMVDSKFPSIMNAPFTEEASLDPFRSHPHANRLLNHPEYYPIRTWSRLPKPSTGEDGYFAGTLATSTTIPHCLTLRRRWLPSLSAARPQWPSPTDDPVSSEPSALPPDILMLLDLATPGVSGHPSTAHGGIIATCIDEAMSLAVTLYSPPPELDTSDHQGSAEDATPRGKLYTSQLDVRYKRPVTVPGLLIIRAKVVGRVGRKFWVRAQILQADEENPDQLVVTTDAMAFWLQTTSNL
ncbi:HotDog domain-containing protein [Aspergillus pseudonomiae]|uniref:HotDog domain-containing protein n=1 Tax=Aspergillus pseudonomiae TaxID=1506151 RepID=A0A5N6HRP4_9EURO|nr:HotDog domain-containing protein [Aspergillus pseudonomiae]KAB8256504.1 HotDog domain-containing protein [Aspergillus pseudonomiae]KAE8397734.1 HotDog domain-containing protein [Aspergillus pseudonomiae]